MGKPIAVPTASACSAAEGGGPGPGPLPRWHCQPRALPAGHVLVDQGSVIASSARPGATPATDHTRHNVLVGVLFGCGIIAFVDEAVFHQLLHWHHFYDRSTTAAGLVSDGLFHAFSWFATVASLFLFADLRRRRAFQPRWWTAGILLGIGGFQLFDGVVQHKVLDLHEVRYGVDLLPYDLAWNGTAVAFLLAGVLMLLGLRRSAARSRRDG